MNLCLGRKKKTTLGNNDPYEGVRARAPAWREVCREREYVRADYYARVRAQGVIEGDKLREGRRALSVQREPRKSADQRALRIYLRVSRYWA